VDDLARLCGFEPLSVNGQPPPADFLNRSLSIENDWQKQKERPKSFLISGRLLAGDAARRWSVGD
jgi:hypothetical protein